MEVEEYGFGREHGYVSLKVIFVQQDVPGVPIKMQHFLQSLKQ